MIVSCPSCQTRYHWRAAGGGRAVCDRCEAQVPLVPSRPTYVVRAQAAAVAVAARGPVSSIAVEEPRPGPLRPSPAAAVPRRATKPAAPEAVVPLATAGLEPARRSDRSAAPLELATDSDPEVATRRAPKRRGRSRSALRRALQLLASLFLGAGGVAGGHYAMMNGWIAPLSVHPAVQPVDPRLAGGLLGVMLAWLVIRWTSPRS